jgi:hypothetical protein
VRGSYIAEDRKKIYFYFVQSLHSLKYCCFFEQSERAKKPTQKQKSFMSTLKKISFSDIAIISGFIVIVSTAIFAIA